jgi:hypothetical protein
LVPRRIKGRPHHPEICRRPSLRGNFRAPDDDAQVLLAKHRSFGQTNFKGAERTIAGILEFIDDVKMDAAWRCARNENLRLPVGKLKAGAQGLDAARREHCPRNKGNRKNNPQPYFRKQGETILPGLGVLVKSWSRRGQ